MGKTFKDKIVIDKDNRKPLATGHKKHDQGCGRHDSRPKRQRTRSDVLRQAMKEQED